MSNTENVRVVLLDCSPVRRGMLELTLARGIYIESTV
jgi:hypothetical protein